MSRSDAFHHWDRAMRPYLVGEYQSSEPEGRMPVAEALERVDLNFRPWEKFHKMEKGYIEGLAEHVSSRGIINPIQFHPNEGYRRHAMGTEEYIYDGHHRLAAAELAGLPDVPFVRRKPG